MWTPLRYVYYSLLVLKYAKVKNNVGNKAARFLKDTLIYFTDKLWRHLPYPYHIDSIFENIPNINRRKHSTHHNKW